MIDSTSWILPTPLPAELPAAAAAYATAGVAVFPCIPGGKRPLTAHGFQDATTDTAQVDRWWRRFPFANIGIPTGQHVEVLDIDVHATGTGYPTLRTLQQQGLISGWGQAVRSPSDGLHLYYPTHPEHDQASWSRGRAHVDFRGLGGYIIAPPSTLHIEHGDRRYEVIARGKNLRPIDADQIRELLIPWPEPTVQFLAAVHTREASAERIAGWVSTLGEGNRNAGLFWAACRLAEAGHPEHDTLGLLAPAATSADLAAREILTTIRPAHRSIQLTDDPGDSVAGWGVKDPVTR